jgi:hypothetical protein
MASYKIDLNSTITKAVSKEYLKLRSNDALKYLSKAFNRHQFILVESEENGKKHFSICESKHLLRSITNEK